MFLGKYICDECEYPNAIKAAYCEKCGAALDETITIGDSFRDELLQRASQEANKHYSMEFPAIQMYEDDDIEQDSIEISIGRDVILVEQSTGIEFCIPHDVTDKIIVGRGNSEKFNVPMIDLSHISGWVGGVSRYHACMKWSNDNLFLMDNSSKNGTFLNGERITPKQIYKITDNDTIRFGFVKLFVKYQAVMERL